MQVEWDSVYTVLHCQILQYPEVSLQLLFLGLVRGKPLIMGGRGVLGKIEKKGSGVDNNNNKGQPSATGDTVVLRVLSFFYFLDPDPQIINVCPLSANMSSMWN